MGLCCSRRKEAHSSGVDETQRSVVEGAQSSAVVKCPSLEELSSAVGKSLSAEEESSAVVKSPSVEEQSTAAVKSPSDDDLRFEHSLPHDYIQQLVEDFRQSSSPERMRRVTFNPDTFLHEYVSASYHLPGAYVDFFPCPHCTTYKDEEGRLFFVEVFHFANVHTPDLCATVTFIITANALLNESNGCRVKVDFTKGCPKAPIAVEPSPRVALHMATDVCIEALRFLSRSELEKMLVVSRRWSNVIGWAAGTLQQRRVLSVRITFYGTSPGLLSIHFFHKVRSTEWRILRVLTTRGLSQALNAVRSHLRNAFVTSVVPRFFDLVLAPDPPLEMLVDIPLPARIEWLKALLLSMPPNSEIGAWSVSDARTRFDNLLTVASCAIEPHGKLAYVQRLRLKLLDRDATWAQLASLLNHPTTRAFSDITVSTTRAAIDTSKLRALLSSWQSQKLRINVASGLEPLGSLLKLPAQIIRDFLDLRDANSFVAEFWLHLEKPKNTYEVPDVDVATDRRKRFRCPVPATVARVAIYENRAAREYLTVMTFDNFRGDILFRKGNVSLDDLKVSIQRA